VIVTVRTGIRADEPGATGVTYTRRAIEEALADQQLRRLIDSGVFLGGFLDKEHIARIPKYEEMTHIVRNVRLQGNEIYVDVELTGTPLGLAVQKMITEGVPIISRLVIEVDMDQSAESGSVVERFNIRRVHLGSVSH